jgi:hypothetical protein
MHNEPRETLGESMFPYKGRIPESGSWAATISLRVMAILGALCGVWLWTAMMALISLGVCPPLCKTDQQAPKATDKQTGQEVSAGRMS